MELYFIRHAIAEPLGQQNQFTDEKRVLTREGRERMREIVKGLRKLGLEVELILTSPLARAVETAEIVADCLGLNRKDIRRADGLAPEGAAELVLAEIKTCGAESIALVGHQPDLGMLAARITRCETAGPLSLRKGGVCRVSVTETVPAFHGELEWLLTPKQLRLLGRA